MERHSPSILFVDDDHLVLESLQRSLRHRNHNWSMQFEADPEAAIESMRAKPAQIVVSDLTMKSLNGFDMIETMKQTAPKHTKYMMLTGTGDYASAVEAINTKQVYRFLTKPCPVHEIIKAIEEALQEQQTYEERAIPLVTHAVFEKLSFAFLILQKNGKVVYRNASAQALLDEKDGLAIDGNGICRAANAQHTKILHNALQSIIQNKISSRFLRMPRLSEKRNYKLVLSKHDAGDYITVIVTDPEMPPIASPSALMSLLGLTHAEAKLAHAIASGNSLEEYVETSGITISSARTYLKRIFAKLGVSRQADLAKRILCSPAALLKEH